MTIELFVYPVLVFLSVTFAAKLIERQSDVLYGPYIQGRKTVAADLRDKFDAFMAAVGLRRREYGRLTVKFATFGILASTIIG